MSERRAAAVSDSIRDGRRAVTLNDSESVSAFSAMVDLLSSTRVRCAISAGAGALLACAFAPLYWWPLAALCPAMLMWLLHVATPRVGAWLGFLFYAGTFTVGTYCLD